MRTVAALTGAGLLAAMAAVAPAAADAGPPDEQGYWWRSPVLAADQTVPEGGLVVAGNPEGALAVSALRFTLDDPDEQAASIHLTVDSDTREGFVEEPLLWACPPDDDWTPEEGGDWDDAPGEHCSPGSAADGALGEDEDEYVFVVSNFIRDGELDVMITPGIRGAVPSPLMVQLINDTLVEQIGTGAPWPGPPTVGGADGSNFRVTFAPPGSDALRTGQDSADESRTALNPGDSFGGGFDDPDESGFESDASTTDDPPDAAAPDTSTPDAPATSAPSSDAGGGTGASPETAQPPRTSDDEPVSSTPPDQDETEAPVALDGDERAGGLEGAQEAGSPMTDPRWLGALILALAALAAGMLAMNTERRELGGLAQFARPRTGPPIRL